MPHVVVKLWPGASAAQKRELGAEILDSVTRVLGSGEDSVSVGFEEVPPADWMSKVYEPDIARRWDRLVKRPGYGPGAPQDPSTD